MGFAREPDALKRRKICNDAAAGALSALDFGPVLALYRFLHDTRVEFPQSTGRATHASLVAWARGKRRCPDHRVCQCADLRFDLAFGAAPYISQRCNDLSTRGRTEPCEPNGSWREAPTTARVVRKGLGQALKLAYILAAKIRRARIGTGRVGGPLSGDAGGMTTHGTGDASFDEFGATFCQRRTTGTDLASQFGLGRFGCEPQHHKRAKRCGSIAIDH